MEATTETTETKTAAKVKAAAIQAQRDALEKEVTETFKAGVQEAFSCDVKNLNKTEMEQLIYGLGALSMANGTLDPVVSSIRKTQHFDITNWRYHADAAYKGIMTVGVGAGAFALMSYLTRRNSGVEVVSENQDQSGNNPFSDTTSAFTASERPGRRSAIN